MKLELGGPSVLATVQQAVVEEPEPVADVLLPARLQHVSLLDERPLAVGQRFQNLVLREAGLDQAVLNFQAFLKVALLLQLRLEPVDQVCRVLDAQLNFRVVDVAAFCALGQQPQEVQPPLGVLERAVQNVLETVRGEYVG